jgi:dihydroneopterin aldolase
LATVIVSGIGFEGRHGATAPERLTTRKFEVDVEIDAPLETAEGSDRLSDTIDFRDIAEVVVSIGTGEPHHLLESLARRMVEGLLVRAPKTRIRLELRKIAPPYCAGNPASAAIRITHPEPGRG